jgi:N-acetylglucosaminyldiphosphoundecaprenol N-acetyl-beta-D-mannosaminyltransferase
VHAQFAAIDALAPDILWLSLGAPREQAFAVADARRLRRVGVIRTAGRLVATLAGSRPPRRA